MVKRLVPENDFAQGDGDIPSGNLNPRVLTGASLVDLTASEAVLKDQSGMEEKVLCDSFIVSMGRKSDDVLFENLRGDVPEIYRIGDAEKIGEIFEAMKSANEIGRTI
jgi:hypothetical protein